MLKSGEKSYKSSSGECDACLEFMITSSIFWKRGGYFIFMWCKRVQDGGGSDKSFGAFAVDPQINKPGDRFANIQLINICGTLEIQVHRRSGPCPKTQALLHWAGLIDLPFETHIQVVRQIGMLSKNEYAFSLPLLHWPMIWTTWARPVLVLIRTHCTW